jgi:hypothetical protein
VARKHKAPASGTTPAGERDPNLPVLRPEVPAYVLDFYVNEFVGMPAREWLRSLERHKKFAVGHGMEAQLQRDGLSTSRA